MDLHGKDETKAKQGAPIRQIEHNPNEHMKFPNYGERKWAEGKFGERPSPGNLFAFLLPIAAVAVAMFLWRGY